MNKMYTSFQCKYKNCKGEFVLLTDSIDKNKTNNKYISCPYCGSKNIKKIDETDNLKECMNHGAWRKDHGVIRQIKL